MVLVDPVMGDNGRCLWNLYRRSAGKDASAGGKRPCDYALILRKHLLLLYGKEGMEKRYARPFGSWMERKRLEQIGKIGEQLKKEYGLTGSCDYRRGV